MEAIKARVREMEEEAEQLKKMQSEVEKQMNLSSSSVSKCSRKTNNALFESFLNPYCHKIALIEFLNEKWWQKVK